MSQSENPSRPQRLLGTTGPDDWLTQQEVARLLRISERTASVWAAQGRLRIYEHGVENVGRRRYSRALILRHLASCMEQAAERQDRAIKAGGKQAEPSNQEAATENRRVSHNG